MDKFSISQLAKYSGIKAHTIRIWEKRYNALSPERTQGNTRFYSGEQLRRLLNIVSLKNEEPNIALLCSYPDVILHKMIREVLMDSDTRGNSEDFFISQLISSGIHLNEKHFNEIFSQCLSHFSVEDAYRKVLYALLKRVGILWSGDEISVPCEHFISNMLRQKFYALMDSLVSEGEEKELWLLFLKEGEFHELGLLFASYLLKKSRRRVIYFGANTPFGSLVKTASGIMPTHVLTFQVQNEEASALADYIKKLSQTFPKSKICIGANMLSELPAEDSTVKWLKSLDDFELMIKK